MTTRRITDRHAESRETPRRLTVSARPAGPRQGPDDSAAFSFGAVRHSVRREAEPVGTRDRETSRQRLIAVAMRPCFCCEVGFEPCDVCRDRTRLEARETCDYCLGTGYRNCDFCGGSGLVTYDAIPAPLRVPVAIERIREAARRLDAVLHRTLPASSRDEPRCRLEECARTLLEMNRETAILENGLAILDAEARSGPRSRDTLARVIRFCLQRADACERRMREILRGMAALSQRLAQGGEVSAEGRETARKLASLYAALLSRPTLFAGTGFERTLLSTALARLRKVSASSAPLPGSAGVKP